MLINWYVVVSQIVNFIIVILILKFFLYRPILEKINNHQKKIEDELQDAALKQKQAHDLMAQMEKEKREFDHQSEKRKKKLKEELDQLRDQLLENAKGEVEKQKTVWVEDFKLDQNEAYKEYRNRMTAELFSIVRTSVQSLSHVQLEEAIIDSFLAQIKAEKEKFLPMPSHMQIKTALEISNPMRQKIQTSFQKEFGKEISFEFVTEPRLIAGIALYLDGKKLSWNMEDYLATLQKPLI
jgi:F-type H+-transporting ATPase subunit b